jgi:hypothetical protein
VRAAAPSCGLRISWTLTLAAGVAFFAHACKPVVRQRWQHAFLEVYNQFLLSLSPRDRESPTKTSADDSGSPAPPLWLGTVPLPILYVAYSVLVEKGVSVTDDALLQVVTQPDVLFRAYQDVQISAMHEHEYGMVRGAAATAYAQVFEAMAECGSLDYMIKAEAPSTAAGAADEEEEDDPNREIAWWCIPPDSDMARGKDTLLSLVGQSHVARLPRPSSASTPERHATFRT